MFSRGVLALAFFSVVGAFEVLPTNDTWMQSQNQLFLKYGGSSTIVEPLTINAGYGASANQLSIMDIQGNLRHLTTETLGQLTKDDIVLVSCDAIPSMDTLSPTNLVATFIEKSPKAIVLYSFESVRCNIIDARAYKAFYTIPNFTPMLLATMTNINQEGVIQATNRSPSGSSSASNNNPQRTPAVAMSILYAVTGIITILFLVIIATGAWRAHTNPERYGPRGGFAGRPRQSRAKGLARAMLETLPIVKFGDPMPVKGENGDVELQRAGAEERRPSTSDHTTARRSKPEVQSTTTPDVSQDDGSKDIPDEDATKRQSHIETQGSNTGCSICTEDFSKGEDVRVLPCNHQYHPNCIDPWLLNVSGTCPLCRIDLRPVPEVDDAALAAALETPSTPPIVSPGENHTHHSRVHRILALRHASVHERIVTLRQLATEAGREQENEPSSESTAEEERRRRRVAERLRSALRVRTRRASTSGPSHAGAETASAQAENTVTPEGTDGYTRT